MKRLGFVSNSSSSSFVLDKSKIAPAQLEAVLSHIEYARKNFTVLGERDYTSDGFWCSVYDWWDLDNSGEPFLAGSTA